MKNTHPITLAVISLLLLTGLNSCVRELICLEGKGPYVTRTIDLPLITGISLEEGARVHIRQGNTQEISVRGKQNVVDRLREHVDDGIWSIDLGNSCFYNLDLEIDITMRDLKKVFLSGSGDIIIQDFEDQGNLDLIVSGSGYIRMSRFEGTTDLDVVISGSGDIYANGDLPDLQDLDITISGSGNFEGFMAETDACEVTISGSGDAYTRVSDYLGAIISGSGNVHYKGFPVIDATITGSGRIINEN